jgi:DNA repair protein SbcC/Rad50
MIELVTVELTNFRSFSHAVFEPLGIGQGMTAINGANGMGKSSVVHGVVWALYGVTPDGVRVSALRRQDAEGDTEVKVTLRHDGQTIVVTRAIRGRNDTTVSSIEVDGVEQTNVSSRTATNWIVNRFGLDAEAFLTAFVVRQKELDSLVKARPAERRKTIERLAGIERMSKALELARADARLSQKTYDALPPLIDSASLTSEKESIESSLQELLTAKESKESSATAEKNKLDKINSDLKAARQLQQTLVDLENKIELEESRLGDLKASYDSQLTLAKLADGSEELTREQETINAKLSDLIDELEAAKESERNRESLLDREKELSSSIEKLTSTKVEFEGLLKQADIKNTEEALTDIAKKIIYTREKESVLAEVKGAARGEWDRLKKAIDTLESHAHDNSEQAKCPTCDTAILDVEILLKSLRASLKETEEKGKAVNLEIITLQEIILGLEKEQSTLKTRVSEIKELERNIESLQSDLDSKSEMLSEIQDAVSKLKVPTNMEALVEEKLRIETRQKELIGALAKIESAINAKAALPALENKISAKGEELTNLSSKYDKAQEEFDNFDIVLLEEEVAEHYSQYQSLDSEIRTIQTEIAVLNNQLINVSESLDRATAEEDSRKLLLAEVEAKTTAATTLDEFRRDRLARLTPELSEVASDFVSRMTDGKYTSVLLDEDFTPILTDASGAERPIAWLSGGEESAVALALRVAIGEVLAGQRGGLLILDEALTAQDASRRQSTMGAIRVLPRQVITINHVSEATDMVDLVAEVVPAEDGGSTIHDMVPENGRVDSVSDEMIDA